MQILLPHSAETEEEYSEKEKYKGKVNLKMADIQSKRSGDRRKECDRIAEKDLSSSIIKQHFFIGSFIFLSITEARTPHVNMFYCKSHQFRNKSW